MRNPFGANRNPNGEIVGPRYDSKPTQPKDTGEMSREEEIELFDATLERDIVADRIWYMIQDTITEDQQREIVRVIFRKHVGLAPVSRDFTEGGRLIHKGFADLVDEIVDSEDHNTDMSKD